MNNKQQFEYNSFSSCAKDADSMKKFFFPDIKLSQTVLQNLFLIKMNYKC